MTQDSMPWTGTTPGDGGPYSAAEWTRIWRSIIGVASAAGGDQNSGILWGSGNTTTDRGLTVTQNSPTGQSVIVTAGAALVNGTFYNSDASVVLAVAANGAGNPRIDTVVLRKDFAAQTVRLAVKQGTPAASPVPPGMTQSAATWEIPIADLTLANGFLTITTALIAGRFNYKNVAAMDVIENMVNASGITAAPGDVAVWGTTAGQFTTSALRGAQIAGIVMDRISAGGTGRLLRRGLYPVRLSGAAATLNSQVVHESNFVAVIPATLSSLWNSFAVTREITAGAGLCLCYVDVVLPRAKAIIATSYATPADIIVTTANGAYADIDGTNIKLAFITNTGNVLTRFRLPVYFSHAVGTGWMYFNMLRDGTTLATSNSRGVFSFQTGNSTGAASDTCTTLSIEFVWKGLTPGSHSVTLQWKNILGTATAPNMGVRRYDQDNGHEVFMLAQELDQTV